jgi:hypothetical protein
LRLVVNMSGALHFLLPVLASTECSCASRDPHVTLAYGGNADFRGADNKIFNFLSGPGVSVNVMTQTSIFKLQELVVNGTYITKVYFNINTADGQSYHLTYDADELNNDLVSYTMVTASCGQSKPYSFGLHGKHSCSEIEAHVDFNTLHVVTPQWEIRVRGQPIYNRVSGPMHRLDVAFESLVAVESLSAHGIIGQSFDGSGIPRYGRMDLYPPLNEPGEFTTSAMAQGAIEGAAMDYEVSSPFSTTFKYSRFDSPFIDGEVVGEGLDATVGTLASASRELQSCWCASSPPPSPASPPGEPGQETEEVVTDSVVLEVDNCTDVDVAALCEEYANEIEEDPNSVTCTLSCDDSTRRRLEARLLSVEAIVNVEVRPTKASTKAKMEAPTFYDALKARMESKKNAGNSRFNWFKPAKKFRRRIGFAVQVHRFLYWRHAPPPPSPSPPPSLPPPMSPPSAPRDFTSLSRKIIVNGKDCATGLSTVTQTVKISGFTVSSGSFEIAVDSHLHVTMKGPKNVDMTGIQNFTDAFVSLIPDHDGESKLRRQMGDTSDAAPQTSETLSSTDTCSNLKLVDILLYADKSLTDLFELSESSDRCDDVAPVVNFLDVLVSFADGLFSFYNISHFHSSEYHIDTVEPSFDAYDDTKVKSLQNFANHYENYGGYTTGQVFLGGGIGGGIAFVNGCSTSSRKYLSGMCYGMDPDASELTQGDTVDTVYASFLPFYVFVH